MPFTQTFVGYGKKVLQFSSAAFFITSKTFSSIGQTIYSIRTFNKIVGIPENSYADAAIHAITSAAAGLSTITRTTAPVLTTVGLNNPDIERQNSQEILLEIEENFDQDKSIVDVIPHQAYPTTWKGKLASGVLQTAAIGYGVMSASAAYTGVVVLGETLKNLLDIVTNADPQSAAWKETIIQVAGVICAIGAAGNFFSYDFKNIQQNARQTGIGIDQMTIPCNKAVIASAALSGLNNLSYPAMSFFWTRATLKTIPGVEPFLTSQGVNIISLAAAGGTAIFVIGQMPSVYKVCQTIFNKKASASLTDNQNNAESETKTIKVLKFILASLAYGSGTIDAFFGSSLGGPFVGVITIAKLFDLNPYHPAILTLASISALNATVGTMSFSIIPGVKQFMKLVFDERHDAILSPTPITPYSPLDNPTIAINNELEEQNGSENNSFQNLPAININSDSSDSDSEEKEEVKKEQPEKRNEAIIRFVNHSSQISTLFPPPRKAIHPINIKKSSSYSK